MLPLALEGLGRGALAFSFFLLLLWLRQRRTRIANAVDVAWAFSFSALAAWLLVWLGPQATWRSYLVAGMIAAWSLRLGGYLFLNRILRKKTEDGRYARLRAEGWSQTHFFVLYQFQAVLSAALSVAWLVAALHPDAEFRWLDAVGILLWLAAIVGEATADAQLSAFTRDPANRGKTCRRGLWRYSRHPNYFFEWLHWWSYVAIGITAPWGLLTLLGPALMLFFLLKLTGIKPTEAQALRTRSDYADYQRNTSSFIPWPPKN